MDPEAGADAEDLGEVAADPRHAVDTEIREVEEEEEEGMDPIR